MKTKSTVLAQELNDVIAGKVTTNQFMTNVMPSIIAAAKRLELSYEDEQDVIQDLCEYLLTKIKEKNTYSQTGYSFFILNLNQHAENYVKKHSTKEVPLFEALKISEDSIDDITTKLSNKKLINDILSNISSERYIEILKERYGFNDGKPKSLEETGKKFNISSNRVFQLENNVLNKLRRQLYTEKYFE